MRQDEYIDTDEPDEKHKGLFIALVIVFLPSILFGLLFYFLLRFGKLRFRIIALIATVVDVISIYWFTAIDGLKTLKETFVNFQNFSSNWTDMILPVGLVWLIIGSFIGLFFVGLQLHEMGTSPYRLQLQGDWMYGFRYRRTPLEMLKKRTMIAGLKDGSYNGAGKSPLGLCEDGDFEVVSRYQTEANKHTLIVGNTGSGKSVTMQSLIYHDIMQGIPTILIDMKSSPEFSSKLAVWTKEAGGNFYHFINGDPENYDVRGSSGQAFYDPLKSGTPTSKADRVLKMREYDVSAEVYKENMRQLLQTLFGMLKYADRNHKALKIESYRTLKTVTEKPLEKDKRETFSKRDVQRFVERPEVLAFIEEWVSGNKEWVKKKSKKLYSEKERQAQSNRNRTLSDKEKMSLLLKCMEEVKKDKVTILEAAGILEKYDSNVIDWDEGGIYQVYSATKPGALDALAEACSGTPIEIEAREIAAQSKGKTQINHALEALRGQMRTIVASEYGRWMKLGENSKNIDLFSMSQKLGTVILFSINSDSEPDFARYVGSMIMDDLTAVSADRRNKQMKNDVNVYVDEFQAINPSAVAGLLEKSRESGISMTLAQQSFEQIVASTQANGEAYLLSVLDTCSNFIVHAGMTEDSAERLSKIIGKEYVETYSATRRKKSFFLSFNWSANRRQNVQSKQEQRWKFDPVKFMELSSPDKSNNFKSTAVFLTKTCSDPKYANVNGAVARKVWMIPNSRVLETYYIPRPEEESYDESEISDNSITFEEESYDESEISDNEDEGGFNFEKILEEEADEFQGEEPHKEEKRESSFAQLLRKEEKIEDEALPDVF